MKVALFFSDLASPENFNGIPAVKKCCCNLLTITPKGVFEEDDGGIRPPMNIKFTIEIYILEGEFFFKFTFTCIQVYTIRPPLKSVLNTSLIIPNIEC